MSLREHRNGGFDLFVHVKYRARMRRTDAGPS